MPLFRRRAPEGETPSVPKDPPGWVRRSVALSVDPVRLGADLVVPDAARAVVVFAHGSGSSRRSPRNVAVADVMNRAGLGTLLFDLLTTSEAEDRDKVFDVNLLARRLEAAAGWVWRWPGLGDKPVAFFGASTGAAAALVAASHLGTTVASVVSRGGRAGLAEEALERVTAPTLFVVGSDDPEIVVMTREVDARMRCERRVEIVEGAGHLFEEPGALERVAELAAAWVASHLEGARGGRTMLSDVF